MSGVMAPRRMGQRWGVLAGLSALSLLLAACQAGPSASPTTAAKPAEAAKPAASSPAAQTTAASPAASPGAAASPAASPAAAAASPAGAAKPQAPGGLNEEKAAQIANAALPPVNEAEAAAFFRGKTITWTIGYNPGGGADTQARLLAVQLPKYIPGNPEVVVTNVPGADSLLAAQQLLRRQGTGLEMGHFSQGHIMKSLTGTPVEGFDPFGPMYVGMVDAGGGSSSFCARTEVANNLDAFLKTSRPLRVAETSPVSNPAPVMEFMRILNLPIQLVYGYGGTAEIRASFDRKETDATNRCGDADIPNFPHWFNDNFATPLFYWGDEPPDVMQPLLAQGKYPWYKNLKDVVNMTAAQSQALDTYMGLNGVHVHALPPRTPENLANAIKRGWILAVRDPQYVQDLRQRGQDYAPITGEDLRKRIEDFKTLAPETVQILGKMYAGGN